MKQDKFIYYPLFASRQLNGGAQDETEKAQVREALFGLDSDQRLRLMSTNMAEAIAVLDDQFAVPEQFVEYVTVLVREMFFGTLSEQEVLRALRGEFTKIPNTPLDAIIQHIQLHVFKAQADPEEIEEEEQEQEEGETQNVENIRQLPLLDALGKYPNINNQFVTRENIKLKTQVTLVRPTLSNWIKNYRDELGIGKHDAVVRAKFLFESSNTKKLTSEERDRIHAIIRSIEDNETLDIDIKQQEILFVSEKKVETIQNRTYNQASAPNTDSAPTPDIFERFQAQVPRDDLRNVGTQNFRDEKVLIEKRDNQADAVLTRIKNMAAAPVQANAPAPKEDFVKEAVVMQESPQEEPMGTLRFSAKHVLPAERKEALGAQTIPPATPQLAHFRPQEVPIPESPTPRQAPVQTRSMATGPQSIVHAPEQQLKPIMQNPVVQRVAQAPVRTPIVPSPTQMNSAAQAPTVKEVPPMPTPTVVPKAAPVATPPPTASIFRIKPSRD